MRRLVKEKASKKGGFADALAAEENNDISCSCADKILRDSGAESTAPFVLAKIADVKLLKKGGQRVFESSSRVYKRAVILAITHITTLHELSVTRINRS